jgi:Cytochrome c7 and related cytochrome c
MLARRTARTTIRQPIPHAERRHPGRGAGLALAGVIALCVCMLASAGGAHAQKDFFESSPGPLSESHATIDGRDHCNDCHTNGSALSNDLCTGCHDHKDLGDRIRAGKGFHSSSQVKGKKCESCHLEHKGRSYDLRGWRSVGGERDFDHKLTGWPLEGKHATIDCSRCHKRTNRQGLRVYLEEADACGDCHADDQPHGFVRMDKLDCERCHNESVWKPAKRKMDFNHNNPKDADMPLLGSHDEVTCGKCHPGSKFNLQFKEPAACQNCHKSPHAGHLFGTRDCQACHSPLYRTLDQHQFDHGRETRFALTGAHSKVSCYECHTPRQGTRKPGRQCELCHADDNKHGARFNAFGNPPKCDTCHPAARAWMPEIIFDHNKDQNTRFDLTGKHTRIECRACHRGKNAADFERFDPKTVGCRGCHAHKDVHKDDGFTDSQCLDCHEMPGVKQLTEESVDLYHGPTSRFPLTQKHAGVACEKCHEGDVYKNTPIECGARCHEDRLHKGTLGDYCRRCHNGGLWDAIEFDHTEDTKWPLEGLHQTVPECASCHPGRNYAKTPTQCSAAGCHAADDAHQGKLGETCDKCHQVTGENLFNHNAMSEFKLDGAHLVTRCSECHPSITFKPQPTNCFGCHPEPQVHKGQYGTTCEGCHSTATWKDIQMLHDVGDFSLDGSHDNLPCVRCHSDSRPLAGAGNLCVNCHRQDDIHSNSLSPRCGECHTQWSFTPARFEHSTVGCMLTGVHRTLPCYDCHKTGTFGPLSATCYSCHRDSALRLGTYQGHAAFTECARCHNPNAWRPAQDANAYLVESICR